MGAGFGNCETNSATLDHIRNQALENKGKDVIAIARLGKGEMSRELNRRRLYTVKTYLAERGISLKTIVQAEG